ncbi:unnamed protein product, partial [Closterium sp. Naga37s-1]
VAERTLFLWNNDYIVSLVAQNRAAVLPLIFGALERNARSHWNQAVNGLTINVRKMFLEMDQALYEDCQRQFLEEEVREREVQAGREHAWRRLEEEAAARSPMYGDGGGASGGGQVAMQGRDMRMGMSVETS